jgi:drug/metabolite transporter (DMT)-like permease
LSDHLNTESKKRKFWLKPAVWLSATFFCIFLWGSAFPAVKTGYQFFQIDNTASDAVPSLLLFAGLRFSLAGLFTVLFTAMTEKIRPIPNTRRQWLDAATLAIPQTIFQYGLFFVGLANTSGAAGSIMSGASSFISVILASLIFIDERLDLTKILGCIIGFSGIVILNLKTAGSLGFNWRGDGLMLLSAIATAIGAVISKPLAERNHPRLLSGWNFILGGLALISLGLSFGGSLEPLDYRAWLILTYLSFLSSTAFALWTTMVKYHSVSKLSVFKSLIPVVGTVGSGIVLGENILQIRLLIALVLVVAGIGIVNYNRQINIKVETKT